MLLEKDGSVGSVMSWLGVCFTAVLRMRHALWPSLHVSDLSRMLLIHWPIFWDPSANLVGWFRVVPDTPGRSGKLQDKS